MWQGDAPTEFQQRRRRALRVACPWLLLGAISSVVANFVDNSVPYFLALCLASSTILLVGVILALRIYRCPNCDTFPFNRGIELNPLICPTCGIALK